MKKTHRHNMILVFRKVWRLMTWDWTSLLVFEVLYKIMLLVLFQYGQDLISYSLGAAGIQYLTNQNIMQIFKHPVSAACILAFGILAIYLSFVEISAVILYCECAARGRKTGVLWLLAQGSKRAFSIFHPRNTGMMILVLLMMPLTGIVLTTGPLSAIKIPGFILEFIYEKGLLSILYFTVIAILLFFLLQWIFSIQEFILKRCTFREARAKSRDLVKGKRDKIFLCLLAGTLFSYLIALILKAAAVFLLLFAVKLTNRTGGGQYSFWFVYQSLTEAGSILFAVLRTVCLLSVVMAVSYQYTGQELVAEKKKKSWKKRCRMAAQILAAYVCIMLYTETINPYQNEIAGAGEIQVVAHRAGAVFGPENTIAALQEAIRSGADSAEIDVQQTKNRELVVMHDTDFRRIAGVDKKVWEVTYEEAARYEIGRHLMQGFEGEHLPTLEEMMKAADGKIELMIELKNNGHEEDLEKQTVELIRKYGYESKCTVASMDYTILQSVKKMAPELKTVYIAAIGYGNMEELVDADAVSIEQTFVTAQLIGEAHRYGKKFYAWTVNQEKGMKRMMNLKVDGIVTDNTYFTFYVLNTRGRSIWVMNLVERVLGSGEDL